MTSLAVLYLLLGAEFLAIAQVIVYAGAIMVLFILKAQGLGTAQLSDGLTDVKGATNIEVLSTVLFTRLLLPFEVTSVLILIAILGAVALARHGDGDHGADERKADGK
jgi:NADH-quinone oxidoreductase subunit J